MVQFCICSRLVSTPAMRVFQFRLPEMTCPWTEMIGLTAVTSGVLATAVASPGVSESVVSAVGRVDVTRLLTETPPLLERPLFATLLPVPGAIMIIFDPRLEMVSVQFALMPWIKLTIETTADTPMKIPRVVSSERRRFAHSASPATEKLIPSFPARSKSPFSSGGRTRCFFADGPGAGMSAEEAVPLD